MFNKQNPKHPKIKIEHMTEIGPVDMNDLCEATEKAIEAGGGLAGLRRRRVKRWRDIGKVLSLCQIAIFSLAVSMDDCWRGAAYPPTK